MLDARGRDIGEPILHKRYIPATPELVERTRRNIVRASSNLGSAHFGVPMTLIVDFGEKPEWYGQDT